MHRFILIFLLFAQQAIGKEVTLNIEGFKGSFQSNERINIFEVEYPEELNRILSIRLVLSGEASKGKAKSNSGTIEMPVNLTFSVSNHFQPGRFSLSTPTLKIGPLTGDFVEDGIFGLPNALTHLSSTWPTKQAKKFEIKVSWGRLCPSACRYELHANINIKDAYLILSDEEQSKLDNNLDLSKVAKHKLRISEVFACSDYCPEPRENYMVKAYRDIKNKEDCLKVGGRPFEFFGWGNFFVCAVR